MRQIAGGLNFATNRKDTTVRYPMVVSLDTPGGSPCCSPMFMGPLRVKTEIHFDGATEIRWTQNPSSGYSGDVRGNTSTYHDDIAAWDYQLPAEPYGTYLGANPPPNITGTRESVINRDTDHVFYAGIAFGTATAGYMTAIQALFEWLASESDSGSSATLKRRRMRL
jgi:hypothetical protein